MCVCTSSTITSRTYPGYYGYCDWEINFSLFVSLSLSLAVVSYLGETLFPWPVLSTASKFLRARRIVHVRGLQSPTRSAVIGQSGSFSPFSCETVLCSEHIIASVLSVGTHSNLSRLVPFSLRFSLLLLFSSLHDLRFIDVGIFCPSLSRLSSCYRLLYSSTVFSSFVQIAGILYLVDTFCFLNFLLRTSFVFVAHDSLDFYTTSSSRKRLFQILRIFSSICYINHLFAQLAEFLF